MGLFFRCLFYFLSWVGVSAVLYFVVCKLSGAQSGTGTLSFCGFTSFVLTILLAVARSYSLFSAFFEAIFKGFSFDLRERQFRREYPQIPYSRWGSESPAYAVFPSSSRNGLIRQLRSGRADDDALPETADSLKSGFFVVYGPPNAGKETLLLGESLATRKRVALFVVPESVWMNESDGVFSVKNEFVKAVNDLMGGYKFWEGPHVLLVLDTERLFLGNESARLHLKENVQNWWANLLKHNELVTVVLKITSLALLSETGSAESATNDDDSHYVGYLDSHECYEFAKKIVDSSDADNEIQKIKKKFPYGLDSLAETQTYIYHTTRGVPSAVVALVRPDLGLRAESKIVEGWRKLLRELGVRDLDEVKRFLAALYVLSLLKDSVVDLDGMAEMFGIDGQRLFKFMSSLIPDQVKNTLGGILPRERFEVSWFTDVFPEELLIRSLGGHAGDFSFGQEISDLFCESGVRSYLAQKKHLPGFVENLKSAVWTEGTLWKLMPKRIHAMRVLAKWMRVRKSDKKGDKSGATICAAIEDAMLKILYDYMWKDVVEKKDLVPEDEINEVLYDIVDEFKDSPIELRLRLFDVIAPTIYRFDVGALKKRHNLFDVGALKKSIETKRLSLTNETARQIFVVRTYYIMGLSHAYSGRGAQNRVALDEELLTCMEWLGETLTRFFRKNKLSRYVSLNNKLVAIAECSANYRGESDVPGVREALAQALCDCADFILAKKACWDSGCMWDHILTWLYAYDTNVFNSCGFILDNALGNNGDFTHVADKLIAVVEASGANSHLRLTKLQTARARRIRYKAWQAGSQTDQMIRTFVDECERQISKKDLSVSDKLWIILESAWQSQYLCQSSQNQEVKRNAGDYFFGKIKYVNENSVFPIRNWYCAYLTRFVEISACSFNQPAVVPVSELRDCFAEYLRFLKQMLLVCRSGITILTASDTEPVFEILSNAYGNVGDPQIDELIEQVAFNPYGMLKGANTWVRKNFLKWFSLLVLRLLEDLREDCPIRFYEAFCEAVRVWTDSVCTDWREIAKIKPRDDEKYLPQNLLHLACDYLKALKESADNGNNESADVVKALTATIGSMIGSGYYAPGWVEIAKSSLAACGLRV